ncbi:flagellar basal body rod protein FlgC [Microbulbifer sp. ANSA003]|uniref:flagellar basal body rod protein FlgC n=1 Tax=unclassified Microbulbifer TaxID=2619833 RepID=UPI00403A2B21
MSLDSFSINLSGLNYHRQKIDSVASNIANANVVAKNKSEAYKAIDVVAYSSPESITKGVENISVIEKNLEAGKVYSPSHPFADADGYIYRANVDIAEEMVELMTSIRSYQANIQALEASKKLIQLSIDMGKR